jgi:hypothetical protein
MARHYKQQPMFRTPLGEQDSDYAKEIRDHNRRVDQTVPAKDHWLRYHCPCGRQGRLAVYCRAGEVFAHVCPICGRTVPLEANPVNPANRPAG